MLLNALRAFRPNHPNVTVELLSMLSEHRHAELQIDRI
jgi:hypothetical protein